MLLTWVHFLLSLLWLAVCCYGLLPNPQTVESTKLRFIASSHRFGTTLCANPISPIEDDGYSANQQKSNILSRFLQSMVLRRDPGVLVLVRHGETAMNYNKTFTGWIDTDLSETGMKEIKHAANLIIERGINIDVTYTSRLKRAIRSVWIMLIGLNAVYKPVYKSWRLNERMYGDLEGQSKVEMARKMGKKLVQGFRRGLLERPPPMQQQHPYWHGDEPKYADLGTDDKPLSESLQDTMDRTIPLWESRILPDLKAGKNVMIVAHANSLRGIVKHVDGISAQDIPDVHIPNAVPLVYKFQRRTMQPVTQPDAVAPLSGEFLEKSGLLKVALEKEARLSRGVPGFDRVQSVLPSSARVTASSSSSSSESSVSNSQLRPAAGTGFEEEVNYRPSWSAASTGPERDAAETPGAAELFSDTTATDYDDPSRATDMDWFKANSETKFDAVLAGLTRLLEMRGFMDKPSEDTNSPELLTNTTDADDPTVVEHREGETPGTFAVYTDALNSAKATNRTDWQASSAHTTKVAPPAQYIVITRHGKTHYNRLGIFTGWEDAPLADQGREEARAAGRLLRLHGIQFQIVYTSWLSRAIETAWLILDELDMLWLPINKTWRLNERMYGALTGMSKKMIAERHGKEQFKKWRRGYTNRPPPTSSFSSVYPGNDERYLNNELDIRYSFTESLIRSISHRKIEVHRKFPKTESLRDCMSRTIPYYTDVIVPQAIAQGKNVLISSSENAIRGLLMHLCNIPPDRIHEVEIPTGLPLIYNLDKKCIQLLDDGIERPDGPMSMLQEYNFGSSPELLFRPCDVGGGDKQDQCFLLYGEDGSSNLLYDPILRLPPQRHISISEIIDSFDGKPERVAAAAASDISGSRSITPAMMEADSSNAVSPEERIELTLKQRQMLENLDS